MEEALATKLTCRELDVLGLLAGGLSNRLIARRLDISEKTVKNHLSSIYLKIGATDRTQAALYARHVGLPDPGKATPSAPASVPASDPVPEEGSPPTGPALTARERGVLRLLARGLSNRVIARRLDISEKTVKNHLSSIYLKIGAAHRTQAALYAQCVGLAS
ncbi:response regulator transcription factor [Streptomyces sp. CBMA156]|uniref:response regulator transcription factor n=1 Tax=Streptomyces sp. CBMA156 TaxID=1930280 RepID=UPI003983CC9E